jgi:hypothetical protein
MLTLNNNMLYYLYEITNILNGKKYIGVHQTKIVNDNYMGSGALLKKDIKKYGLKYFEKKILQYFPSFEEMYAKEKQIVNDKFLKETNTYNLREGGKGGFNYINSSGIPKFKGKTHSEETIKKLRNAAIGRTVSLNTKTKQKDNHWSKKYPEKFLNHVKAIATNRIKSEEEKNKISNTVSSLHKQGVYNYKYAFNNTNNKGKRWIHRGKEQKMIFKTDPLPNGWKEKRK